MDNNEKVVDDVNWCARGVNLFNKIIFKCIHGDKISKSKR